MTGKELLNTQVNLLYRATTNKVNKNIKLLDWFSYFSTKNENIINAIRQKYNIDPRIAKQMKSDNLCCITVTGFYEGYRTKGNLQHINPIIAIDIDKADNPQIEDWDKTKENISKLPYVFFTSYSCSGNGLFCLVYFDNTKPLLNIFNALYEDFLSMNINIDKACKDEARLRFISYDNNMLIRQGEVEQYNKEVIKETNISYNTNGQINESDEFIYMAIYHLITECNYKANDYVTWLNDCFRLATFGELGYILFRLLSQNSDNYNFEACNEKFKECSRTTRYDKSCLIYYFGILKKIYGKEWRTKLNCNKNNTIL